MPTRSIDAQMTDVRKICTTTLEGILANIDDWHHAPRDHAWQVMATIVCRVAQGFGCDGEDIRKILDDVRVSLEGRLFEAQITGGIPGIGQPEALKNFNFVN